MTLSLPVISPEELRHSALIGRPIDNTALSMYTTCPRKFLYGMVFHRRKEGPPSPGIGYGSAWHVAMETHYKFVPPHQKPGFTLSSDEIFDALYQEVELQVCNKWEDHSKPDDYRTLKRVLLEYKKYVRQYGLPWHEDAKTIGWPDQPLVEIATELAIPGCRHPYTGKIDRIIQQHGQYFVEDHKTTSRDDGFGQWDMDNQMIGYATMAWVLTGQVIAGVRINRHVVRKNDSVFDRRTIPFGADRLRHWMNNLDKWLMRIEDSMRLKEAIEAKLGEFPNNPDYDPYDAAFPHNFSACAGKYGMCQYASICSLPPRLRQQALEDDFQIVPWNPLEAEDAADA